MIVKACTRYIEMLSTVDLASGCDQTLGFLCLTCICYLIVGPSP